MCEHKDHRFKRRGCHRFPAGWIVLPALLLLMPWWLACDSSALGQLASAVGSSVSKGSQQDVGGSGIDPQGSVDPAGLGGPGDVGDPDDPDDPNGPPHPCIEVARDITLTCVEQTHDMTVACIDGITQLFRDGMVQEALDLARQCRDQVVQHTDGCLQALEDHCRECVAQLIDDGAPLRLIKAVLSACHRGADTIVRARRRAVHEIEETVERGLAHACAFRLNRIGQDCADQNRQIAADTVDEILALLANGEVDEAIALARQRSKDVLRHTAACIHEIRSEAQGCLRGLDPECGDGDLVRLIHEAADNAARLSLRSARLALQQIHDALPPPPPPDGDNGNG